MVSFILTSGQLTKPHFFFFFCEIFNSFKHTHSGKIVCKLCSKTRINGRYRACYTCAGYLDQYGWKYNWFHCSMYQLKCFYNKYYKYFYFTCCFLVIYLLADYLLAIAKYLLMLLESGTNTCVYLCLSIGSAILSFLTMIFECICYCVSLLYNGIIYVVYNSTQFVWWDCIDFVRAMWMLTRVTFWEIVNGLGWIHDIIEKSLHYLIFDIITLNYTCKLVLYSIYLCIFLYFVIRVCIYPQYNRYNPNSNIGNTRLQLIAARRNSKNKNARVSPLVRKSNTNFRLSKTYHWVWLDDDGTYKAYLDGIGKKIENLAIGSQLTISINKWNYTIKKSSVYVGTQTNTQTGRVRNIMRRNGRYTGKGVYDDFENNSQLYVINMKQLSDVDTILMNQVRNEFWQTMKYGGKQIIKIQKCQFSDLLFEAYNSIVIHKCDEYNEKAAKLERYLWHGTSFNNISQIIKTGFDRSFCKTYAYGKVCRSIKVIWLVLFLSLMLSFCLFVFFG